MRRPAARLVPSSLLAASRVRQLRLARLNLKVVTPAVAIALASLAVIAIAAPPSERSFAARTGPVAAAALAPLHASAKPLLVLSLDGGYWSHRAPCWAGLMPITIVYENGAVITLPPKRPWVRGQLDAAQLDQLRDLAVRAHVEQYVGKSLTAVNGSDMAILHVLSAVADPSVEVEVYGYSPFDYNKAGWEHGATPEPLAQLIDSLFALREIEAIPYSLPVARMRIVDTGQSCAWKCPWPKAWPAPAIEVRNVRLQTGDLHELDSEWERTCPPEVHGGKPRPQPRGFCKGDEQLAWCAGPVFPNVPDGIDRPVPPHR